MAPKTIQFPYEIYKDIAKALCHIAAYLDALRTKADSIRAAQLETQKELAALMPAVLDRAFRGEL